MSRHRSILDWARHQMRQLDRRACQAIGIMCLVGIIAHWLIH